MNDVTIIIIFVVLSTYWVMRLYGVNLRQWTRRLISPMFKNSANPAEQDKFNHPMDHVNNTYMVDDDDQPSR